MNKTRVRDEDAERLAIHNLNKFRAMTNTPPVDALVDDPSWLSEAREQLAVAYGETPSRYDREHTFVDHRSQK